MSSDTSCVNVLSAAAAVARGGICYSREHLYLALLCLMSFLAGPTVPAADSAVICISYPITQTVFRSVAAAAAGVGGSQSAAARGSVIYRPGHLHPALCC